MPATPALSPGVVRDFLLQAAELGTWSLNDAAKMLGVPAAVARDAARALETVGYIEKAPKSRDRWRNTEAGNQVAGVSKAREVKRETAAGKLEEFVERCEQVNRDKHYLFAVKRAVVYGPYLNKSAKLKNVDVAVELSPKERKAARHEELMKARGDEAATAGKRFSSYLAKRAWGKQEVLEFLKGRSRTLAVAELDDHVLRQPHEDLL